MAISKKKSCRKLAVGKVALAMCCVVALSGLLLANDAHAVSILMITNNNTTSQSLNDFLEGAGHTVTRGAFGGAAPTPAELAGVHLVLVARETNSGDYDDGGEPQDWNALPVPMISMAPHLMRASRWGWINGESLPGLGDITDFDAYPDPSHPFLTGVSSTAILDPAFAATGASSPLPASALVVATHDTGASHGIFVIPAGTDMFNGRGTAGDVRVGYIRGNEGSWDNITADGEQILLNMIDQVAIPEPSTLMLAALGLFGLACLRRRRAM